MLVLGQLLCHLKDLLLVQYKLGVLTPQVHPRRLLLLWLAVRRRITFALLLNLAVSYNEGRPVDKSLGRFLFIWYNYIAYDLAFIGNLF